VVAEDPSPNPQQLPGPAVQKVAECASFMCSGR
jgi:hypothetical protein